MSNGGAGIGDDERLRSAQSPPPSDEGLSLDKLNAAFAAMLAGGEDPYGTPVDPEADALLAAANVQAAEFHEPTTARPPGDETCEISPRTILEAMLFVGRPDNQPLSSQQVAGLMRGVRPGEIDALVNDLNATYRQSGRPYEIVAEGAGYRLSLRPEFRSVGEKLYGRPRTARLSPAAIEVLALVAYNEPLTAEQIARQRGVASNHVLAQLVRRQLLRIERPANRAEPARYYTAPRFLQVFGLESLADLPRSQELDH